MQTSSPADCPIGIAPSLWTTRVPSALPGRTIIDTQSPRPRAADVVECHVKHRNYKRTTIWARPSRNLSVIATTFNSEPASGSPETSSGEEVSLVRRDCDEICCVIVKDEQAKVVSRAGVEMAVERHSSYPRLQTRICTCAGERCQSQPVARRSGPIPQPHRIHYYEAALWRNASRLSDASRALSKASLEAVAGGLTS